MKTVWKYPIKTADAFELTMPEDAKLLTVALQFNEPTLWALVDPEARKVQRGFRVAGTGHPMSDAAGLAYVGTYQMADGHLVFHVFDAGQVSW